MLVVYSEGSCEEAATGSFLCKAKSRVLTSRALKKSVFWALAKVCAFWAHHMVLGILEQLPVQLGERWEGINLRGPYCELFILSDFPEAPKQALRNLPSGRCFVSLE